MLHGLPWNLLHFLLHRQGRVLSVGCSLSRSASASSCLSLGTQVPGGSEGGQGERTDPDFPGDLLDSDAFLLSASLEGFLPQVKD